MQLSNSESVSGALTYITTSGNSGLASTVVLFFNYTFEKEFSVWLHQALIR
jgi:hypothetical protein